MRVSDSCDQVGSSPSSPSSSSCSKATRYTAGIIGVVKLLVFVLVAMVDISAAFLPIQQQQQQQKNSYASLVPSQVVKKSSLTNKAKKKKKSKSSTEWKPRAGRFEYASSTTESFTVLSQAVGSAQDTTNTSNKTGASMGADTKNNARGGTTNVVAQNNNSNNNSNRKSPPSADQRKSRDKQQKGKRYRRNMRNRQMYNNGKGEFDRAGNLPDIEWRTIPMDHLREHPNFIPLPHPDNIECLENLEDVRLFRQDSWQWDALHAGRCTTSQAVTALGFLEPGAGMALKVPKSWWRSGESAYYRMQQPALRTLANMNDVLCAEYSGGQSLLQQQENHKFDNTRRHDDQDGDDNNYWMLPIKGRKSKFLAKYTMQVNTQEKERRRKLSKKLTQAPGFGNTIRMMWGNTQEATALLTALNFFAKNDSRVVLREVGMCGAGLHHNATDTNILLGASPDGLLCYPNGDVEVVEVKNHCPYSLTNQLRYNSQKRFRARDFIFHSNGVQTQYVPQLMMEMLCVGENCRSAIMVRQTATNGARILRIKRDDGWIKEMLHWLQRFQTDFVNKQEIPPTNFFFENDPEEERYRRFLEWTKKLESSVDLLAHVPHNEIQRAVGTQPGNTPLFLD